MHLNTKETGTFIYISYAIFIRHLIHKIIEQTTQLMRPLSIRQKDSELTVLIPSDIWDFAEQLKDEFTMTEAEANEDIVLASQFLHFTIIRAAKETQFSPVASTLFLDFDARFLKGNNIHVVAQNLDDDVYKTIIKTYYTALVFLKTRHILDESKMNRNNSALFQSAQKGDARLFAIFGGQGNSEEYFEELVDLWDTYPVFVKPIVERMALVLNNYALCQDAKVFHPKGLDILQWLLVPETKPDTQYLIAAPVSLPLIGLIQLLYYYVMVRVLDVEPREVRDLFQGKLFFFTKKKRKKEF
jgi:fatty acid synthase subunit beta